MLCLASKNDEADVLEVLELRAAEMAVSREQLTAWEVQRPSPPEPASRQAGKACKAGMRGKESSAQKLGMQGCRS